MRMFKIIAIVVGVFILAIVGVFVLGSGQKDDMAVSAEAFFDALARGDTDAALALGSKGLAAAEDEASLMAAAEEHGITGDPSLSVDGWSYQQSAGRPGTGRIDGILTLPDGAVPYQIALIKPGDVWLVNGIAIGDFRKVPDEAALAALVSESNRIFARNLATGDFTELHAHASQLWRDSVTPEGAREGFAPMAPNAAIFRDLFEEPPSLPDPARLKDGRLEVTGAYVYRGDRIVTEHVYVREGFGWRLLNLALEVTAD